MKKLLLIITTIIGHGALLALPIRNPSEVNLFTTGLWSDSSCCDLSDSCFCWGDAWSMRIGFSGYYVFNRHMQVDNRNGGDIDCTQIFTNAAQLTLNVCYKAEIFATLGVSNLSFHNNLTPFSTDLTYIHCFWFPEFSWSVGGRVLLWECGCFNVGMEGEYFRTTPQFNYFLEDSLGQFTYINGPFASYNTWQIGVAASYRFTMPCSPIAIVPYVGLSWAEAHLNMYDLKVTLRGVDTTVVFDDLKSRKLWGFGVGTTFILGEVVGVTVEGRFADQKAIYVNGQFRF